MSTQFLDPESHVAPAPVTDLSPTASASESVAVPAEQDANESLADESRNPTIPPMNLGSRLPHLRGASDPETGLIKAIRPLYGSESLAPAERVLLSCREHAMVDAAAHETDHTSAEDSSLRFTPPIVSSSTMKLSFSEGVSDAQAAHELDLAVSRELLAVFVADGRAFGSRGQARARTIERHVECVFGLGISAYQLLSPHDGRYWARALCEMVDDLGEVGLDILRDLRVFLKWVADNDSQRLSSGENLRALWGRISCPLQDGDIRKRKPKSDLHLPSRKQIAEIHDAAFAWARDQRQKTTATRTASIFSFCCETGLRGVETRNLSGTEHGERGRGVDAVPNPLVVVGAKGGRERLVRIEPYGRHVLDCWLSDWRPLLCEDAFGPFFPARGGKPLSSASLSETSSRLLRHLKERGLLHKEFTFHSTRKVYATHFTQRRPGEVDALLEQCGWTSATMLAHYIRATTGTVEQAKRTVAMSAGRTGS